MEIRDGTMTALVAWPPVPYPAIAVFGAGMLIIKCGTGESPVPSKFCLDILHCVISRGKGGSSRFSVYRTSLDRKTAFLVSVSNPLALQCS